MMHAPRIASLAALLLAPLFVGCGPDQDAEAPVVQQEGPEDEILRIGEVWEAKMLDKGLRSEPSKISIFESRITSTVTFERGSNTAHERLVFNEDFKLRNGAAYVCAAGVELDVRATFGRRGGAPTVHLSRPPLELMRKCNAPGFPEPTLNLPATASGFVLEGDQLTAYEPGLEKRIFLPIE